MELSRMNQESLGVGAARQRLQKALQSKELSAYFYYVENWITRKVTEEHYDRLVRIFIQITSSSRTSTIRNLIDTESQDSIFSAFGGEQCEYVADDVLYMIGVWQAALNCYRRQPGGYRPIELAYSISLKAAMKLNPQMTPKPFLENTPASLLVHTGLLPSRKTFDTAKQIENVEDVLGLLEAASIPFSDLNVYTMCKF